MEYTLSTRESTYQYDRTCKVCLLLLNTSSDNPSIIIKTFTMFCGRKGGSNTWQGLFLHNFVDIWWIWFSFGYDMVMICVNMSPKFQNYWSKGRSRNCTRQFACRSFVYLCDFDDNAINFVIFQTLTIS